MDYIWMFMVLGMVVTLSTVSGQGTTTPPCVDGFHGAWINNTHPSPHYRNDTETAPDQTVLNQLCDPGKGTLKIQCQDDGGEPFTGTYGADTANKFTKSCTVSNGLICRITEATAICPDFAIQYGCTCAAPAKGGSPTAAPTGNGTHHGSGMRSPVGVTAGSGNTGSGSGGTGSGGGGSGGTGSGGSGSSGTGSGGSGSGGAGSGGNGSAGVNISHVVFVVGLILSHAVMIGV